MPEQHEAFWAFVDDVARAPWGSAGTYDAWAQKMTYKCKVDDLRAWYKDKGLDTDAEHDASKLSRRDMLDALVRAAAGADPPGVQECAPGRAGA